MATLDDIANTLSTLPAAVAQAVVAALPPQSTVDTTAIETAITNGFAALTTEIKTNVEGTTTQPVSPPTSSSTSGAA